MQVPSIQPSGISHSSAPVTLGCWPLPMLDTRAIGVHREIIGLYQMRPQALARSRVSLCRVSRLPFRYEHHTLSPV